MTSSKEILIGELMTNIIVLDERPFLSMQKSGQESATTTTIEIRKEDANMLLKLFSPGDTL